MIKGYYGKNTFLFGSIHRSPGPQEAISIDQAADEILEGVEAGRGILPIQDFARKMYHAIGTNPSEVDEMMWNLAHTRHEDPLYKVG